MELGSQTALSVSMRKLVAVLSERLLPRNVIQVDAPAVGPNSDEQPVVNSQSDAGEDELYKESHLASAAGVMEAGDGMIHWQVKNFGKALQLSPLGEVDGRALKICFPAALKSTCLDIIYDATDHTTHVFVLSNSLIYYTFKCSFSKPNILISSHGFRPASLSLRAPTALTAATDSRQVISLSDGSFLRLSRENGGIQEHVFSDSGYLKSLIRVLPWQGPTSLADRSTSPASAISIAGLAEFPLFLSLSAIGTLKTWSLLDGSIVDSREVVMKGWAGKNAHVVDDAKYLSVCVADDPDEYMYLVATFCPNGAGNFAILAATRRKDGSLEYVPITNPFPCQPPKRDGLWAVHMIDLCRLEKSSLRLHVLWKSGVSSLLQYVDISRGMLKVWMEVVPDCNDVQAKISAASQSTSEDVADKWLDYFKYNAKFSSAVLQTAISIYSRHCSIPFDPSIPDAQLPESAGRMVGAHINLGTGSDENIMEFREAIDAEWRKFCRLCLELDYPGQEAFSLYVDRHSGLPFILKADGMSCVRTLHVLESAPTVDKGRNDDPQESAQFLVSLANKFAAELPQAALDESNLVLDEEMFLKENFSIIDRMGVLFDRCLSELLTEPVTRMVESEILRLENMAAAFELLVDACTIPSPAVGKISRHLHPLQESVLRDLTFATVDPVRNLILLLSLLEFADMSDSVERVSTDWYLVFLRTFKVLSFVSEASTKIHPSISDSAADGVEAGLKRLQFREQTETLNLRAIGFVTRNVAPILSDGCIYVPYVLSTVGMNGNWGSFCLRSILDLLFNDAITAAYELSRYLPQSNWGIYVKFLVYAHSQCGSEALAMARDVAWQLSLSSLDTSSSEAQEISRIDVLASADFFGRGVGKYYQHIAETLDRAGCAKEALEACKCAMMYGPLHPELAALMFQVALDTSDFECAYTALSTVSSDSYVWFVVIY